MRLALPDGAAAWLRAHWLRLSLLAAALLALHLSIAYSIRRSEEAAETRQMARLELGTQTATQLMLRYLEGFELFFEMLEDFARLRQQGATGLVAGLERRLDMITQANRAAVFQAALVDADGINRWSTLNHNANVNLSDRPHFRAHLQPGSGLFVSERLVGRVSGRPSVQLSRRLTFADGSFAGVGVLSLDPALLAAQMATLEMEPGHRISLFRANGSLLAISNPEAVDFGASRNTGWVFNAEGFSVTRRVSRLSGEDRFIALRRVPGAPLVVGISVTAERVMLGFHERRRLFWLAEAGLALLILSASASLWLFNARIAEHRALDTAEAARQELARVLNGMNAAVFVQRISTMGAALPTNLSTGTMRVLRLAPEQFNPHERIVQRAEPPWTEADRQHHFAMLRETGSHAEEMQMRCGDGSLRWMRLQTNVISQDADGLEVVGLLTDIEDVKTAEAAVAAAAEMRRAELAKVLDGIDGAIYLSRAFADGSHIREYMSAGARRLLRLDAPGAQYQDDRVLQHLEPPLSPQHLEESEAHLRAHGTLVREHQLRRADGSLGWVRISISLLDQTAESLSMVGAITDITEEKAAQAVLLHAAEERRAELARVLDGLDNAVFLMKVRPDATFTREYMSAGVRRLLRLSPDAPHEDTQLVKHLVPPLDTTGRGNLLHDLRHSGRFTVDSQLRRADGTLGWVRITCTTIGHHGDVIEAVGSMTDITTEREAMAAVSEAAEVRRTELARVLNGIEGAVYLNTLFPDGSFRRDYMSVGAARMLRLSADGAYHDDVVLNHVEPPLEPADRQAIFAELEASGRASRDQQLRRADGSLCWIRSTSALIGRDGDGLQVVGSVIDISDEKSATAAAISAARLATLGELAAGLAHEMNQPLAVILLSAENMKNKLESNPAEAAPFVLERLERIGRMTRRAKEITDHLRLFAHRDGDSVGAIAVPDALRGAQVLCGQALRDAEVELTTALPEGMPEVMGTQVLLEHVLLNLLMNARDALAAQPADSRKLLISATVEPTLVHLHVADSGPGIPSAILPRLFEPFFSTKPAGIGTGLGLCICQGILQSWGASISAANAPPEAALHGAIFTITLRRA